jgi:hypothetical protein
MVLPIGKLTKTNFVKGHCTLTMFSFLNMLSFYDLSNISSSNQPSIFSIVHFRQKLAKFITADNLNGCHKCKATDVLYMLNVVTKNNLPRKKFKLKNLLEQWKKVIKN